MPEKYTADAMPIYGVDICAYLPACDLQDLMVSYYKANVAVNDSRVTYRRSGKFHCKKIRKAHTLTKLKHMRFFTMAILVSNN